MLFQIKQMGCSRIGRPSNSHSSDVSFIALVRLPPEPSCCSLEYVQIYSGAPGKHGCIWPHRDSQSRAAEITHEGSHDQTWLPPTLFLYLPVQYDPGINKWLSFYVTFGMKLPNRESSLQFHLYSNDQTQNISTCSIYLFSLTIKKCWDICIFLMIFQYNQLCFIKKKTAKLY